MKNIYILLSTFLFSVNIHSQGNINGNITGATQQALIDFGNRSTRAPQPLNIQGSHYFDEKLKFVDVCKKDNVCNYIFPKTYSQSANYNEDLNEYIGTKKNIIYADEIFFLLLFPRRLSLVHRLSL